MVPHHGTYEWHPHHRTRKWHPTMARYPLPKSQPRPPPNYWMEVRTPIALALWGKTEVQAPNNMNSAEELCGFGRICELGHPVRIPSVGWIWNAKRSGTQSRKEGCLEFRHFRSSLSMFVVHLYINLFIYWYIYHIDKYIHGIRVSA